jgi:hypothetical protein
VGIVNENMANGWLAVGGPFVVNKKLWAERPKTARGELVAQALVRQWRCRRTGRWRREFRDYLRRRA